MNKVSPHKHYIIAKEEVRARIKWYHSELDLLKKKGNSEYKD